MHPSKELVSFLEATPLPWLRFDPVKEKLIMVVDNHLLSTYRQCPQHFIHANVEGRRRKLDTGIERAWFLDFGILLHKMVELYYRDFHKPDFDLIQWATTRTLAEWNEMKMDVHAEHKEYKSMGGVHGLAGLLIQYGTVMSPENEKLRIIGQEVSFGRAGEVPLLISENLEIYLAGRMDLIVDDGYFICPMDHKTMGYFKNDPGIQFETDEGPTGYIYALSKILPTLVPENQLLKRDCSKILMNLISKKDCPDPRDRFKRIPIRKSTAQLTQYRDRMTSTCAHLLTDIESYAKGFGVPRNTTACTNWHFQIPPTCTYRDVCRQSSTDAENSTLRNGYVQLPIWNTEEVKPIT